MTPQQASNSYDEVPYPSHPHPLTHPDWLFTVGALFGMEPPPPDRCRVLELGCAGGGNLLSMAASLPESEFVGVDLSGRAIAEGQALAARAGLTNVDLRHASIDDLDESWGTFDYVVCYGVFSWVPRPVQDKILSICRTQLAPNGIAYVNYNALPGGHMMAAMREMMLFAARTSRDPATRIRDARAMVDLLGKWQPEQVRRPFLTDLIRDVQAMHDSLVCHEFLEETNQRFYFLEFIERAEAADLQFLAEAHVGDVFALQKAPADVQAAVARMATSVNLVEQYLDFFRNRAFRQTLLCRRGIRLRRSFDAAHLMPFRFGGRFRSAPDPVPVLTDEAATFDTPGGAKVTTSSPLGKALLLSLNEAWPATVPFAELTAAARERLGGAPGPLPSDTRFADKLWDYFTAELVRPRLQPDRVGACARDRPRASLLARLQATAAEEVWNLRHETVRLGALSRRVLVELDGTRDRAELVRRLQGAPDGEGPLEARVEAALTELAAESLLLP